MFAMPEPAGHLQPGSVEVFARCPLCEELVRLTDDGRFTEHLTPLTGTDDGAGTCPWSGNEDHARSALDDPDL